MATMRLPALTELSARQQEISDRITSRRGGTRGPFLVWLRSPELCEKVEALGAYCRFESALDPRLRELTLLIAARQFDAQYSWNAHVGKAADLGVSPAALAALASGRVPAFGAADEQIVYQFGTEILGDHFVSDDTFITALALLGEQGLVDLIGSLGNLLHAGDAAEHLPGGPAAGRTAVPRRSRVRKFAGTKRCRHNDPVCAAARPAPRARPRPVRRSAPCVFGCE
jgi:4-carboxymuconolactone decarboxylase